MGLYRTPCILLTHHNVLAARIIHFCFDLGKCCMLYQNLYMILIIVLPIFLFQDNKNMKEKEKCCFVMECAGNCIFLSDEIRKFFLIFNILFKLMKRVIV